MDEVENNSAVEEIAALQTSPQENSALQHSQAESAEERNWREMRRINKELEKKVKMQEEMMSQLLAVKPIAAPPSEPIDELETIPDDDYIPKGQVKKLVRKAEQNAEKIAQEAVKKAFQEQEKTQFLPRLKSKFPDFDDVVTPETLELLEQHDPELAQTIVEIGDPYKMGIQSYKFIKSMGLVEKVPGNRRSKEVEKKIEQNAKTVQSPMAFDKRPMAQTFQLTDANKQALWKEMNHYAQMAGGAPQL